MLAEILGCTPDALTHLRLCGVPRAECFAEDCRLIAEATKYCEEHSRALDDSRNLRDLGMSAFRGTNRKDDALTDFLALQSGEEA